MILGLEGEKAVRVANASSVVSGPLSLPIGPKSSNNHSWFCQKGMKRSLRDILTFYFELNGMII